jgi:hypothetical protein
MIPRSANLADFVPQVEVLNLGCGHWIQQGKPCETTRAILDRLGDRLAA